MPRFLIEENSQKVLLDCGNGITRYLNIPKDLENLIVIISHLHKDHYGDLSALAYASFVNKNLGYLQHRIKVLGVRLINNCKSKKVGQFTKDGKLIKIYPTKKNEE